MIDPRTRLWHAALDFIASDATITPEGCPEPWRSTLVEWAKAASFALSEQPLTPEELEEVRDDDGEDGYYRHRSYGG